MPGSSQVDFGEPMYSDDRAVITDSVARASAVLMVIELNAVHCGLRA